MSRCLIVSGMLTTILLLQGATSLVRAAEITTQRTDRGVVVKIDGELFTEYLVRSGNKPILWPVIGPTGEPITRAHPMGEGPGERKDHVHHRSIWFTHGDVNGVSFWHEGKNTGTIAHREFVEVDARAAIATRNDWLGPDGKKICEDLRKLTFGADGDSRWIDFDITLKATDGEVKFGDTKEGTMGIRVAGTMKVDSNLGGHLVNSRGQTDKEAWGKQAEWVDYYGPVEGKTAGVAILNHPTSFRFPTYWHVRTYGLFAANPFGLHHFKGSNSVDGSHTLAAGESITFRYRLLFHTGDVKTGKVAEAFAAFAK